MGSAPDLPGKLPKQKKPQRQGIALLIQDTNGRVLLRRRAESGLLGGMMEVPSTDWAAQTPDAASATRHSPLAAEGWRRLPGRVRHTFTHFQLEIEVMTAVVRPCPAPAGCRWVAIEDLAGEALPTVMRKIVGHGLGGGINKG